MQLVVQYRTVKLDSIEFGEVVHEEWDEKQSWQGEFDQQKKIEVVLDMSMGGGVCLAHAQGSRARPVVRGDATLTRRKVRTVGGARKVAAIWSVRAPNNSTAYHNATRAGGFCGST